MIESILLTVVFLLLYSAVVGSLLYFQNKVNQEFLSYFSLSPIINSALYRAKVEKFDKTADETLAILERLRKEGG